MKDGTKLTVEKKSQIVQEVVVFGTGYLCKIYLKRNRTSKLSKIFGEF